MLHAWGALALVSAALLGDTGHAYHSFVRRNVLEFSVTGYAPLKDVRSFLDVGLKPSDISADTCEVLIPRQATLASQQPWAPFDFYTNILSPEEQAQEKTNGTLGEPDIFFSGDNFNRNSSDKSHVWTRKVVSNFKGSLDFLERKVGKDSFSFWLQFRRGLLSYGGLVSVRARMKNGQCVAAVFLCDKPLKKADSTTFCDPAGWSKKIQRIIAEASVQGAMADRFSGVLDEKKKNDIGALFIEFQDVDALGEEIGSTYVEKVATK
jgi:hypothetical protein